MNRFEEEINEKFEAFCKELGIGNDLEDIGIRTKLRDLINISFNYGAYRSTKDIADAIADHLEEVSCNKNSKDIALSALDDSPENFNE